MRLALRNIARVPSRRFSGKSDYLHPQQRTHDCLDLTQNSMLSAEKARQRGYSGSTHEEIVISSAFAEAVFPRTG